MLPNLGIGELLVILAIALLLFGAKKLPEVAKAIGKSFNAFKSGLKDVGDKTEDLKSATIEEEQKKQ